MVPLVYNLRSLAVRRTTTIATLLGIALVAFVLASAIMLLDGLRQTVGRAGDPYNAIVMRKGSDAELGSRIAENQVGLIKSGPGVKKDPAGAPLAVAEVALVLALEKVGAEGTISNLQLRGVPDGVMRFRPETRIVAGRPAQPGTDEVIIGRRIRGRFRGLELGQVIELRKNRPVRVVGVFEDGGSSFESEIWADLDTVRTSFGRQGMVSTVRVRLESPSKLEAFAAAIEGDKQLGLQVFREDAFYEKQSEGSAKFITALGAVITFFFSLGAMIGAMITMYASVSYRQREIGTLRALGFSRGDVLISFLFEACVLALAGGLLGAVAATAMRFVTFSMMNFMTWSEVVFRFTPTPRALAFAVIFAGVMGAIGGFFPALRAARISPIEAMRD